MKLGSEGSGPCSVFGGDGQPISEIGARASTLRKILIKEVLDDDLKKKGLLQTGGAVERAVDRNESRGMACVGS